MHTVRCRTGAAIAAAPPCPSGKSMVVIRVDSSEPPIQSSLPIASDLSQVCAVAWQRLAP